MKRRENWLFWLSALFLFLTLMCSYQKGNYYKTREGKAKQKYYNQIQFGANPHPKKKF